MSTHNIGEAILMSTHNVGFYEDLTKIIVELSSNIIKYAPYFFCCLWGVRGYKHGCVIMMSVFGDN